MSSPNKAQIWPQARRAASLQAVSLIARTRRVHFVGIAGIGMSGLAEILLRSGHKVTGSDLADNETTTRLKDLGALIQKGHSAEILENENPEVLVFSSAVMATNPELIYARKKQIPIIRRAEMLSELMRLRRGIAVAGSHGKTTTTGLSSLILKEAGVDPAVIIGGRFDAIGSNAAWGKGPWLVAEADESDGSFLRLTPEVAVVTNIDKEHLNHYGTFEATLSAFSEFLDRLPFYGRAILSSDCPHLRSLASSLSKPRIWYGFEKIWKPDFWVEPVRDQLPAEFVIHKRTSAVDETATYEKWLDVKLNVAGRHNMMNATAAALVARELEVSTDKIAQALEKFKGVQRRFELKGKFMDHDVIEDYAHHPTEIRATLQACSVMYKQKPIVFFQPHRFSRTRELWDEFASCFDGAAQVLTLPIYAASEARETWVEKLDGEYFAKHLAGTPAKACVDFVDAHKNLEEFLKDSKFEGAPILILGAGDIAKMIPKLLSLN